MGNNEASKKPREKDDNTSKELLPFRKYHQLHLLRSNTRNFACNFVEWI